ncbi:MAG TPA: radical SAM protein [Candidatus Hydrogenedens sp.]|nr:radical SAM protein [Candidatus Hydrogenedens sp.]
MKVLFISANTEQISMPVIPIGLGCVAAATQKAGHEIRFIDLMFEDNPENRVRQVIAEFQPECIGITVRNIDNQNIESPRFFLDKVRGIVAACHSNSDIPIVLGGAGYSIFPESALEYLNADIGIKGEGESIFLELLSQLEKKQSINNIPGLYIRGYSFKPQKTVSKNLDAFPLPGPKLLSTSLTKNQDIWIPVQTRRGCPFMCSYCSTPSIEGTNLRKRSPENVTNYLKEWADAGFSNFYFVDNTFNLPPTYAKDLCDEILKKELNIKWRCIIYSKFIDTDLVQLMAKSGCRQISLGFESGSEQVLKNLNKRFSREDIRTVSNMFADYGIERTGFLLLGGPGETRETVEESLEFADSLKLDFLKVTIGIRIYPDTKLSEIAKEQGIIKQEDNLLFPTFYLSPELDREWLSKRVEDFKLSRPNVLT